MQFSRIRNLLYASQIRFFYYKSIAYASHEIYS